MRFFKFLVILAFCVLVVRTALVFMSGGKTRSRYALESLARTQEVASSRADIVDRNGVLLARTLVASDLYLNPGKMFDVEEDLKKLTLIFPEISTRIEGIGQQIRADKNSSALILVKKGLWPNHKQKVLDSGVTGVYFDNVDKRIYPYKNAASHVVGLVSSDGAGVFGAELFFDQRLKQKASEPLQLSIDINLQSVVRGRIASVVKEYSAVGGFGIIMNVKTGEILTAVSVPDFNPNNFKNYDESLLFNHYASGVYELGSVFKVFLLALALQEGVSMTKVYEIGDVYQGDDFQVRDFRFSIKRNEMTLLDIIKYSSNIGCAKVISQINPSLQRSMFNDLMFNQKLNIELPERGMPLLPKRWYKANIVTASYGHGIAVTPLHFINAAAGIVNNGVLLEPTFLKVNNKSEIKVVRPVVSREVSKMVRLGLRAVVEGGTGHRGAAIKYDVGGKSGTAIQSKNGKYDYKNMILSFFAVVPIEDPEYIFYVGVISPKVVRDEKLMTGGYITAPIISEIIMLAGPMLNISMKKS